MDGRITISGLPPEAGPPPCDGDVCITCSDAAVACRVVALDGAGMMALVEAGSARETVSVALVDARPGDTVLVHAGEAIAVVRA